MYIRPSRSYVTAAICILAVTLLSFSVALAQTEDETSATALQFFEEGRSAMHLHRPEAARLAFGHAYDLRPTPEIGYNLGLAEFETGRFVQAARHIALYIHQNPRATKVERQALADAERYVAQLMFEVNAEGTRIYIDDEDMGLAPFVFQPIYVLPGRHTIRASCQGFENATQVQDVEVGRRTEIRVLLVEAKSHEQQPTPLASVSAVPGVGAGSGIPSEPKPQPTRLRPSTRTIVLAGGSALTLAAGIVAIIEGARASSATTDVDRFRAQAAAVSVYGCRAYPSADCSRLADAVESRNEAIRVMRGAVIGTAILGGATAAAWLLWPRSTVVGLRVTPQLCQSMAGITISGNIQ